MLSDIPPPTGAGRIQDKELGAKSSVTEALLFMEKHLVTFAGTHTGSGIKSENGLNQSLCILLNKNARAEERLFFFARYVGWF
ncbi:MAG: hypothetical protein GY757_00795 [bacterium]|nr:hypothetical protein [bacterium]